MNSRLTVCLFSMLVVIGAVGETVEAQSQCEALFRGSQLLNSEAVELSLRPFRPEAMQHLRTESGYRYLFGTVVKIVPFHSEPVTGTILSTTLSRTQRTFVILTLDGKIKTLRFDVEWSDMHATLFGSPLKDRRAEALRSEIVDAEQLAASSANIYQTQWERVPMQTLPQLKNLAGHVVVAINRSEVLAGLVTEARWFTEGGGLYEGVRLTILGSNGKQNVITADANHAMIFMHPSKKVEGVETPRPIKPVFDGRLF